MCIRDRSHTADEGAHHAETRCYFLFLQLTNFHHVISTYFKQYLYVRITLTRHPDLPNTEDSKLSIGRHQYL